jgi:hypothetical protein
VLGERARRAGVVIVADDVGQVLLERAPEGDVEHLHPAAHAQRRQAALDRRPGDGELEAVALGRHRLGLGVRVGAVGGGVGVARGAGDQQGVDALERVRGVRVGREQHRAPAGPLHGRDVGGRHARGQLRPVARRHHLHGGGDAHDRADHNRSKPR